MYALVVAPVDHYDPGRLFLESCTATPATSENLRMVQIAASLLGLALDDDADTQLVDYCANASERTDALHDIVASASQVVLDRLIASGASAASVERCMSRVAGITRAALPLNGFHAEEFHRYASAIG
ncbi:MAG: hypothetical protein NVS2B17_20030 [Candidatus Velthaea sp.]